MNRPSGSGSSSVSGKWQRQQQRQVPIDLYLPLHLTLKMGPRGVLVLLKFYWAPDIVKFVLGRFSHFNIAIAYSNSTFCGAWTPSFCEFTWKLSKFQQNEHTPDPLPKSDASLDATADAATWRSVCSYP